MVHNTIPQQLEKIRGIVGSGAVRLGEVRSRGTAVRGDVDLERFPRLSDGSGLRIPGLSLIPEKAFPTSDRLLRTIFDLPQSSVIVIAVVVIVIVIVVVIAHGARIESGDRDESAQLRTERRTGGEYPDQHGGRHTRRGKG